MRKRTPRRHRAVDPSAALRALGMKQQLDDSMQSDLAIPVRAAALAMRSGVAVENHIHTLASCSNVCLVMAERGAGREYLPQIIAGQMALMRTLERGNRSGRWGFDGPAIAEVETLLQVFDAQLAVVPRDAMRYAVREVRSRMDRGEVFEVVR